MSAFAYLLLLVAASALLTAWRIANYKRLQGRGF